MIDRYFLEVPVYRQGRDDWEVETSHLIAQRRDELLQLWSDGGASLAEGAHTRAEYYASIERRPYNWQYNEVIAWIRLMIDGPWLVKGYLWQVGVASREGGRARKNYRRGFTPFPFVYGEPLMKVIETRVESDITDAEVFAQIRASLLTVVGPRGALPSRHLDLDVFDTIGPHVRWNALCSQGTVLRD